MAKNPAKQFNLGIHKIPSSILSLQKTQYLQKPVVLTPAAVVVAIHGLAFQLFPPNVTLKFGHEQG